VEHQEIHDFVRDSEERCNEARALVQKLCPKIDKFETLCELRVNEALRKKMIDEVEQIVRETTAKAKKIQDEVERYPVLHRGEEPWIYAFSVEVSGKTMIAFSAAPMKKESAPFVVARMEARHDELIQLPVVEFGRMTESLKSLLLDGELDDVLRLDAKRVVYEIMSPRGKLWRRVIERSA